MAHCRGLSGGSGTLERRAHCEGLPAAFGGEEFSEWRADVVADDVIVSDVDVGEDGLVEFAAGGFAGVKVQLVGVLEQVEVCVQEGAAAGEVAVYLVALLSDPVPVTCDLPESLSDAFLWERAVGCEVEEVVFLDGELRELVIQVLAEELLRGDLVGQRRLDVAAHRCDECGAQTNALVVLGDGVLDAVDRGVGSIADVLLHTSAKEVSVVGVAVPSGGAHENHAPVDVVLESALSAPDGALEIVIVALTSFAGVASLVYELLHSVEEILLDE